jgi:hypothetical protein
LTIPENLAAATAAYRQAFGHAVPPEVLQMFASRPAALMLEIRQAVALKKAVPAWRERSRMPAIATGADWPGGGALERAAPFRGPGE